MPLRTAVYVDAFNLYYGALRKRPACKWLDIDALVRHMLLSQNQVVRIVYCTARVKPRQGDPGQPVRQDFYLRALKTINHLKIVEGRYTENEKTLPVSPPPVLYDAQGKQVNFAKVLRSEEKGSDVNLATHLLIDGFQNLYDVAIVISADTDLEEPIRLVRVSLKKKIGIISPYANLSWRLKRHATFYRHITEADLQVSQFPANMTDTNGSFHRPPDWQ